VDSPISGALSVQEIRAVLQSLQDEMRPLVRNKAEVWKGVVVEVIGDTVRVARADEPTVAANLLRQPYPVVGATPAVTDEVWAISWVGGGIVITGGGASSSVPGFFSGSRTSNFTFSASATWTKLLFDTEEVDSNGWYIPGTSSGQSRFTPQVAGWYQFSCSVQVGTPVVDQTRWLCGVDKNGALVPASYIDQVTTSGTAITDMGGMSKPLLANGTTDFFELIAWQNQSSSAVLGGGVDRFWWSGRLLYAT
jgi:hypothetical protein